MRGFCVFVLVAVLGLLGLTSCVPDSETAPAASPSSTPTDAAIVVWTDAEHSPAIQDAADRFTQDTGTEVRVQIKQPDGLVDEFATPAPDQAPPDILLTGHGRIGELVRDGLIAPLPLAGVADDFLAVTVAGFSYDGDYYGVPFAFENLALVRNTDLAPVAPRTWDEALAAGRAADTTLPILVGGQDSAKATVCGLYPFQSSLGAPVYATAPDGSLDLRRLGMGGEPGNEFAHWLDAQSAAGILRLSITSEVAINEFAAGNSPFLVTGPWHMERIREAGLAYSIDPIPQAGPHPATGFVNVQGFVLSASTAQPEQARRFLLEYLADPEVQDALAKASQRPAAHSLAMKQSAADPDLIAFAALGQQGVPTPNQPGMPAMWTDWANAENEIIDRRTADPAGTWQAMVTALQGRIG